MVVDGHPLLILCVALGANPKFVVSAAALRICQDEVAVISGLQNQWGMHISWALGSRQSCLVE